jgi:Raf kinase inhibitor-like YbhB/YbcL family protein
MKKRISLLCVSIGLSATLIWLTGMLGCSKAERDPAAPGGKEDIPMSITVESPAFGPGEKIPTKHTGDGEDVSPALSWSGAPAKTKELALIMDDPDAPVAEPWVHWVLYKIPPGVSSLEEGVARSETLSEPSGAMQGKNSWDEIGYMGPAPPRGHGVHHYHFKVYALDAPLDVKPGLSKKALLSAMSGHILAEGERIGTYQR